MEIYKKFYKNQNFFSRPTVMVGKVILTNEITYNSSKLVMLLKNMIIFLMKFMNNIKEATIIVILQILLNFLMCV